MYDNRFCGPGGCPPLMKMRRRQKRKGLFYGTRVLSSLPQLPLPLDIDVPAPAGVIFNDAAPVREIDPVKDARLVDFLEEKYNRPIAKKMLASLDTVKRRTSQRAAKVQAKARMSRMKLPQADPVSALNQASALRAEAAVKGNYLKTLAEQGYKVLKRGYKAVKSVFHKHRKVSKNSSNMFSN